MFNIIQSMIRTKALWVIVLLIPSIFFLILIPLTEETASEVSVPIVIVDESQQSYVQEVFEEVSQSEAFTVYYEQELNLDELARGEVEAVFEFSDRMQEKIAEGDSDHLITWHRNENSMFDGLFKEELASTIIKDVVRAEAANMVTQEHTDATWEEVYAHGLQYFEPEPIFTIDFRAYDGQAQVEDTNEQASFFPLILWFYTWLMLIFFVNFLYKWREIGILERLIPISSGKKIVVSAWFILTSLIIFAFLGGAITISNSYDSAFISWQGSFIIFCICIVLSLLIYIILFNYVKSRYLFASLVIFYGSTSFVMALLIQSQLIHDHPLYKIFIPVWLLT
ncbi:ABC transporter permease [Halalkalibacillus halophilus]|uniref:ABC transporter permease n=1 Tax=Halalkalibacillus halophilus TaxID=392827 RepID=UPI000420E4F0|nr:ABC transporter permease [Halalkalibacillus halophilus]